MIIYRVIFRLINDNKDVDLLFNIFNYLEELSNCKDEDLINIFSITVLEILGNDKKILTTAQKYMEPKSKFLQVEADRSFVRIYNSSNNFIKLSILDKANIENKYFDIDGVIKLLSAPHSRFHYG